MPLRGFIEGGEDDRQDDETRGRIREIQAGLVSWQAGVDRRYHKVALLLMGMVVAGLLAVVAGYALLQGQRWQQSRDGCERTNAQTDATVGLLRDLKVRESVIRVAQVRYPHVPPLAHRAGGEIVAGPAPDYEGPGTCEEFADARVGWFRR